MIDDLLRHPGLASGGDVDLMLDLRWRLHQHDNAEQVLSLFCELRRRLEHRHYLAFFRVRRWLEAHLIAVVTLGPSAAPCFAPVKVDHYCVEAVRRVSLCAALEHGGQLTAPRVVFAFKGTLLANAQA